MYHLAKDYSLVLGCANRLVNQQSNKILNVTYLKPSDAKQHISEYNAEI